MTRNRSSYGKRTRRVVFQPATYQGVQRGINQLAAAIGPTLGPRPRLVAIQRTLDSRMPELLDNGAVIAKRIIQLSDRDADVGAMFLREVLWQLHDQVGDGTATATVLFQSVYNQAVHYLVSGGNAAQLQHFLQAGMRLILDELSKQTVQVSGKEQLARVAESLCYDAEMARLLGEIFDIIGEYGRLEIRTGRGRELEREYVEGMYWERGLVSREMITDRQRVRTDFENAAILISDLDIEEPHQLLPALEVALRSDIHALLIVAGKLSDRVIGFLLANKQPDKFQVAAVKTPGWGGEEQARALEDIAILTGGRPFLKATGDTFERIKASDFGRARRTWADHRNFGISGGQGDARALRQHIATLRVTFNATDEPVQRDKLLQRIGKLLGGSATLWVGGVSELEIEARKERAERTAAAMRGALLEGVLPGGGVALLNCRPALQRRLEPGQEDDERAAYRILLKAMEVPFRTIVTNAGFDASDLMAKVRLAGPGHGFDVTREQVVDVQQARIYDVATVHKSAVYAAISSAALALTVDVLVHHRFDPDEQPVGRTPSRRKRP